MRLLSAMAFVLTLAGPLAARAQSSEAITEALESEAREQAAADEIVVGVVAGDIDAHEARRLVALVERLRAFQVSAYRDGAISPRERTRLRRLHARLTAAIARARAH